MEEDDESAAKQALKDDLTLLVRSLHPKTGEFDVFQFFSQAGKVNDVKLIVDNYGRCQGVCYVEMADYVALQQGLSLNGRELCGASIVVQTSLAQKNWLHKAGASSQEIKAVGLMSGGVAGGLAGGDAGLKLYVGGLDYNLAESNLREIFQAFGELDRVRPPRAGCGVGGEGVCAGQGDGAARARARERGRGWQAGAAWRGRWVGGSSG